MLGVIAPGVALTVVKLKQKASQRTRRCDKFVARGDIQLFKRGEIPDLCWKCRQLVVRETQHSKRGEIPDLCWKCRQLVAPENQLLKRGVIPDLCWKCRQLVAPEIQLFKRGEIPVSYTHLTLPTN